MSLGGVGYNERSWAIDLIGHLKHLASQNNRSIKDAGAATCKTEGSEHAEGFVQGMRWAAKSISRGFGAMEAMDDDNVRAALSGVQT